MAKKNGKSLKSHLSQADINLGKQRIYFLLAMIVISLVVAFYVMH